MYYGREADLKRLHRIKHDVLAPKKRRQAADKAAQAINQQLKDKPLMRMRERLIRATIAGDTIEIIRITQLIRDCTGEDKETGRYGQEEV